ncbi:MAG: DUF4282 domain-containing protein [Saprospiraceae bacterium]|nr:DUF4282 domain-containing protein [Saprospiraceae bacterium]
MRNRLLFFDSLITPSVITIVYWLLLAANLLYGLFFVMFGGFGGFTFTTFLLGLVYIVVGAVVIRIWCELLIVIFKINDNIAKLNQNLGGKAREET